MFGNFIFLIIALLIYATYQPADAPRFGPGAAFLIFSLLLVIYAGMVRRYFNRIISAFKAGEPSSLLARQSQAGVKRYTIYALIVFAIDIYGLNLPAYFHASRVFQLLPTLEAVIFLALFIFYMAIVWSAAYAPHQQLFPNDLTWRAHITGHLLFNLPILLPWLTLSVCVDCINLLPFEGLKRFLNTTYGQAIYFLAFLFIAAVLAPAVIQAFWRCQPLPEGEIRRRIDGLCRRTGIQFAGILRWPLFGGRMMTAGVMGLVGRFRYLLVTDALVRILSFEEIDAVVAHELGHVKKKHLLLYLLFLGGFMLLSVSFLDVIITLIIYSHPVTLLMAYTGQDRISISAMFFAVVTIAMVIIYFRYIFGFFMRNFERQADTFVYSLFNSARPLISTLKKIAITSGQPADQPNWHHFSIAQRIDYLQKCELDRSWITRQDRKVKRALAVFIAALVLVGGIGYQLNFGKLGRQVNHRYSEKALLVALAEHPDDPEPYRILGALYHDWQKYSQAIEYYSRAVAMFPDNPETLNNLAWLYATCEDESLKNPSEALRLAERAAAIDPQAHILDTLAESYFINGRFEEAAETAKTALTLSRENRSYYEKQLKRFREEHYRTN